MDENKHSFWTTLPGILTGLAALITAVGAIYFGNKRDTPPIAQQQAQTQSEPKTSSATQVPLPPQPSPAEKFTGPMGPLESGVSYSGGDIYDRPTHSPEECSKLCDNDDRCIAVTFIISQQRCWLKNKVNAPQQSSDVVSAQKQH